MARASEQQDWSDLVYSERHAPRWLHLSSWGGLGIGIRPHVRRATQLHVPANVHWQRCDQKQWKGLESIEMELQRSRTLRGL
ncbi:MAG: hypothetical protein CMJ75_20565 [Planctomycetaceae bacterium]|nr:hypothetical protein [Planctomycetaceae bacterium]